MTPRISSIALRRQVAGLDLRDVLDRQQVRDAAELLQLATMENGDAVADVLHVRQEVAGEDDGFALLVAEVANEVLDFRGADRVQAGGRLVQKDQLWVVDQRLGQADAALHAFGILTKLAVLRAGEFDEIDEPIDAFSALAAGILNRRP